MDISFEDLEAYLGGLESWTAQSDGGMAAQTDRPSSSRPAFQEAARRTSTSRDRGGNLCLNREMHRLTSPGRRGCTN